MEQCYTVKGRRVRVSRITRWLILCVKRLGGTAGYGKEYGTVEGSLKGYLFTVHAQNAEKFVKYHTKKTA